MVKKLHIKESDSNYAYSDWVKKAHIKVFQDDDNLNNGTLTLYDECDYIDIYYNPSAKLYCWTANDYDINDDIEGLTFEQRTFSKEADCYWNAFNYTDFLIASNFGGIIFDDNKYWTIEEQVDQYYRDEDRAVDNIIIK